MHSQTAQFGKVHRLANLGLYMSLSLNWKNLSSKLAKGKVQQPVQKKRKKHVPNKQLETVLKEVTTSVSPKTKLLTPLERALWETETGSDLHIETFAGDKAVVYDNKKKLLGGKYIAIDCEFVGVGSDDRSALARVSLVNFYGVVLLDTFVKPKERVTDWRTWVSGVAPYHMHEATLFEEVQKKVCGILKGKVIVGHAVQNDLKSVLISHPRHQIRDTSRFSAFRKLAKGKPPSLKRLAKEYLQMDIQKQAHSSVEDAQVAMAVFRTHMKAIESEQMGKF